MQTHIYATFTDPTNAEKAAGALLDNGVKAEDLTVIQHHLPVIATREIPVTNQLVTDPPYLGVPSTPVIVDTTYEPEESNLDADHAAKSGISTTTSGDAGIGAAKGAGWGIGLGAVAALAALFIPGVGLVIGGGALAMALGGAAATTGAGALAGAVTGYLKDQGFEESEANRYSAIVEGGGAMIYLALPSGDVDEPKAWEIIDKYSGTAMTPRETVQVPYVV